MKTYSILLVSIVLMSIYSCTPEPLDIEIPQAPQQPVLSSQFAYDSISNQSVFLVTITRTLSVTTDAPPRIDSSGIVINPDYFISGAVVTLTLGGVYYELQEVEQGIYAVYNLSFAAGEYAEISAKTAEGKLICSSKTTAMPQKEFGYLNVFKSNNLYHLSYSIEDKKAEQNWYVVNYFTKQENDTSSVINNPDYIAKRLTEQKLDFDLYTDADFINGQLLVNKKVPSSDLDTMAIAISEITQGYYNFLTVQKRYGKLINQLRGEALTFPTNINQGLGYFTLNQPKLYVLPIEE